MNCLRLILLSGLAFAFGACEQHRAAELAQIEETPEAKTATDSAPKASETQPTPAAPGPKFFNH